MADKICNQDLSFGAALYHARLGYRIARQGWNGKGMWVCAGAGRKDVPSDQLWNRHTKRFAQENGDKADVLSYMIMKTADGKILMGWLASQSDLLSDDWVVLDYEEDA